MTESDVPLRVGVAGGGFITQLVHLPTLLELGDRFALAGLADPSARVRERLTARFGIPRAFADVPALLDGAQLDALLVLSPGAAHAEAIGQALERGLHVFVEKPLCLAAADADAIAQHAARAGRVVQVGTMKQHDPAFTALLDALGDDGAELRSLSVATHDPGLERFFAPPAYVRADDVPQEAVARLRAQRAEQVGRAVGVEDPRLARVYVELFADTLVHDVNLVRALLGRLGLEDGLRVADCSWWAGGRALGATLELATDARCTLSLLELPGLQDFREELRLAFPDALHELAFPAPYERHAPTRYDHTVARAGRSRTATWTSWAEPFVEELVHFHDCVTTGAPCRTPATQAAGDLRLLERLFAAGAG